MSATLAEDELLIVRAFKAPAELLFRLWSEPEHFKRWMGPEGFDCVHAEIDFRVGGAYRAMIRSEDTGENWFGGEYREIEPGRRLVFTWAWDSGPSAGVETLVTILFREEGERTVQTFHQAPFRSVESRDSHVGGWTSAFERQRAYAQSLKGETAA